MTPNPGTLVAVEGPSGVGKSSVIAAVALEVHARSRETVYLAKQPSDSAIGRLIRQGADGLSPIALTCLLAADRSEQLVKEIRPRLAAGQTVVCDRYLPSSLVLQVLDGVDEQYVRHVNEFADTPDIYVFLAGTPSVVRRRSYRRGARDRFHEQISEAQEAQRYREVAAELRMAGHNVVELLVDRRSIEGIAKEVAELLPLL